MKYDLVTSDMADTVIDVQHKIIIFIITCTLFYGDQCVEEYVILIRSCK